MSELALLRHFGDWYRTVHMDPSPELVQSRLAGVNGIAESLSERASVDLVQALVRPDAVASVKVRGKLTSELCKLDPSFPAAQNANLLNTMIAGCLARLIDEKSERGVLAALALRCATVSGLIHGVKPTELIQGAVDCLADEGAARRTRAHEASRGLLAIRPVPPVPKLAAMSVEDVAAAQFELIAKNDRSVMAGVASVHKSLGALHAGIEALRADIVAAIEALGPQVRDPAIHALQEETQVLWWLFGEWSAEAGCAFAEIKLPGGALQLGAELAEMTRIVPGHPRANALLTRAIERCQGTTGAQSLADVVKRSPLGWRARSQLVPKPEGSLTPLLSAIARCSEAEDVGWEEPFSRLFGVPTTVSLLPSQWAVQLCDEILLVRTLENAKA